MATRVRATAIARPLFAKPTWSQPLRIQPQFISRSILSYLSLRFTHDSHQSPASKAPQRSRNPAAKSANLADPIRKLYYAFDPATIPSQSPSDLFPFLHPATVEQQCALHHVNAVNPPAKGVPWPSRLPGSLQSKYWVEAEEAAADFARKLSTGRSRGVSQKYIDVVVDTAVHFATNLIPAGNVTRTKILAKAYVLIFMHDDATDSGDYDATLPKLDQKSLAGNSGHLGYDILAQEVLFEDTLQGKRVLEGILSWGSATQKSRPDSFSDLEEYMIHRAEDSGAYPVIRTAEFACGVHHPDHKTPILRRLRVLCAKHYLLTNDLYSYENEALAEANGGATVFNAVRVVQNLMGTSVSAAKVILRQVVLDIEQQMGEVYGSLAQTETTGPQLVYAQALISVAAGNMYFSATSPRYARAVEGSELPSEL